MEIAKSYITDEDGSITGVVIDFETFQKIEEALLDQGLTEAMEEIEGEGTVSASEMKEILKR